MGAAATFTALGLEEMDAELAALSGDDYVDYLRGFQESTLAQPIPAELLDLVVIDFSSDLGSISAPTLIVWGDRDAICPRSQQGALLRAIPGARLSVRAGADHAMHWEHPQRFAAELAAFCDAV